MRCSLLLAAVLVIAGCASSQPTVVRESSSPSRPKWIESVPQNPRYLHFVGSRSGANSLEEGRDAAYAQALSQVAQYLGVKITSAGKFVESTVESENKLRAEVRSTSEGRIQGAEVHDTYHESVTRHVNGRSFGRFDVWVLVRFPREEAEAERARQNRAKAARVESALAHLQDGIRARESGDVRKAHFHFRQGEIELSALDEAIEINAGGFATSRDLQRALLQARNEAQSERRRTFIVYEEQSLGRPSQDAVVPGTLAKVLSGEGFSVLPPAAGSPSDTSGGRQVAGQVGASIALLVSARVEQTGYVLGNPSCTATVQARAVDVRTGEVLAQANVQERGIRQSISQGAHLALTEAGQRVARELAQALISREEAGR